MNSTHSTHHVTRALVSLFVLHPGDLAYLQIALRNRSLAMSETLISSIERVSRQVTIYVGLPIFLFGMIGGSLNVLIFLSLRTFRKNSCSFYLMVMAMVSLGYLLTGLLTFIMIYGFAIDWTKQSRFYCIFREGFVHICMLIALTCLSLATIDQFFATSSSTHPPRWCQIQLARRLCLGFSFFWFLYGIAFFCSYDLILVSTTGQWECTIVRPLFEQYFNSVHTLVLLCALPLMITSFFGSLAYRNVRQASHRAVPMARRELDKQLTVMVLVQVLFYFCAATPLMVFTALNLAPTAFKDPVSKALLNCALTLSILLLYSCYAVRRIRMPVSRSLSSESLLHLHVCLGTVSSSTALCSVSNASAPLASSTRPGRTKCLVCLKRTPVSVAREGLFSRIEKQQRR